MDQALWITWYDLQHEGREAYLSWLHGAHLPALVERKGVLWAAHYASDPSAVLTAKKKPRRHPASDRGPAQRGD